MGADFVSLGVRGVILAQNPSGDFLGQGINDPTLYVFKHCVRVLVPVEGDGLPIERLQVRGIPVEQIYFELDLLFRVIWVLQEAGLDFHGRGGLVHEVVPTTEGGKPVTYGPTQRAGGEGAFCPTIDPVGHHHHQDRTFTVHRPCAHPRGALALPPEHPMCGPCPWGEDGGQ